MPISPQDRTLLSALYESAYRHGAAGHYRPTAWIEAVLAAGYSHAAATADPDARRAFTAAIEPLGAAYYRRTHWVEIREETVTRLLDLAARALGRSPATPAPPQPASARDAALLAPIAAALESLRNNPLPQVDDYDMLVLADEALRAIHQAGVSFCDEPPSADDLPPLPSALPPVDTPQRAAKRRG